MGATKGERALIAANQVGKTWAAGMETGFHATGRYPSWWEGLRFPGPIKGWYANTNNETTRDNPQRMLLGEFYNQGTGTIPAVDIAKVIMARGIADQVDKILVKHQSGGYSQLQGKAYDQRREKWQGETLDWIWLDEEPPADVYTEALARLTKGQYGRGSLILTETPLLGMSDVVGLFYPHPTNSNRGIVQMEIDDREDLSEKDKADAIAGYLPHELEARTKGIPMLGSGRVFTVLEEAILEDPIEKIPDYWPLIIGVDFGWDHPTAGVRAAWDREIDCVHLTHEYRLRQATPNVHAPALKALGGDRIPCAWPQDGWQTDKQSGISTADSYRRQGLNMLPDHATHEIGGIGREAGVSEMLTRMESGRLRVSRLLKLWLGEYRTYHRKDGKLVRKNDDLLDATRAALMMLRFAAVSKQIKYPTRVGMDYDPLGEYRGRQVDGVPEDAGASYDLFAGRD